MGKRNYQHVPVNDDGGSDSAQPQQVDATFAVHVDDSISQIAQVSDTDDADMLQSDDGDENIVDVALDDGDGTISIDEAIEKLGYGKFQWVLCVAAGLCFAADAMQLILLSFLTVVLTEDWKLTAEESEAIASSIFLGALVGTLVLGPLADSIGRRPVFLITAVDISFFGICASLSPNRDLMGVMIFMVGVGVGGLTVPFDILAEFLPAKKRGTSLLMIEYFWTLGSLYVVVMAYWNLHGAEDNWRSFVALCSLPCLISLIVGYLYVPESARWLVSKGRLEKAMAVLKEGAQRNGLVVEEVFPDGLTLAPEPHHEEATIADLLKPRWRSVTLALWGTWGAFAFGYYGTVMAITNVFAKEEETPSSSSYDFDYGAIFVSSAAELVGTTLAISIVDRVGRIPSQVVSYVLAGISVFAMCSFSSAGANHGLLLVLAFIVRVFEMTATCVTWVSTAEVLTTEVRGTGHSTSNAMARVGAFFAPFLVEGDTPIMVVGIIMLIVHSFTAACASRLPETNGLGMGSNSDDVTEEEQLDLRINGDRPTEGGELA